MLYLLYFLAFGLVVGILSKLLRPGKGFTKWTSTLVLGVVGSYIGGAINWLMNGGVFSIGGLLMSVVGGIVFCEIYRRYQLDRWVELQRKK